MLRMVRKNFIITEACDRSLEWWRLGNHLQITLLRVSELLEYTQIYVQIVRIYPDHPRSMYIINPFPPTLKHPLETSRNYFLDVRDEVTWDRRMGLFNIRWDDFDGSVLYLYIFGIVISIYIYTLIYMYNFNESYSL